MRCEPSTGLFLSVVTDGVLSLQQVFATFWPQHVPFDAFAPRPRRSASRWEAWEGWKWVERRARRQMLHFSSALSTRLRLSFVCIIKVLTPAPVAAASAAARVAAAARFSWCTTFWRASKASAVFFHFSVGVQRDGGAVGRRRREWRELKRGGGGSRRAFVQLLTRWWLRKNWRIAALL